MSTFAQRTAQASAVPARDLPTRVRVAYSKRLGLFSVAALDGPKRGKIIDHVPIAYLTRVTVGEWSVSGEWAKNGDSYRDNPSEPTKIDPSRPMEDAVVRDAYLSADIMGEPALFTRQ